ncbi:SRPBCC domain-containing protein, partial [Mangrovicoccus algicola]
PAPGFAPFEPAAAPVPAAAPAPQGEVRVEEGWTVIRRRVTLAHPPAAVWAHFSDPAAVIRCLRGAQLDSREGEDFTGHVAVGFGPIAAKFEGEGRFETDEAARTGRVTGRGKDRGGQSSVAGGLDFALAPGETEAETRADVALRFRIEGRLGQFNRPELVNGLVDHLLGDFVANCDAVLGGGPAPAPRKLGIGALIRMLLATLRRR